MNNNNEDALLEQFTNYNKSIEGLPEEERYAKFEKYLNDHPDIARAAIEEYKAKNPDKFRTLSGEPDDPQDIGALLEELARTDPEGLKEMLKKISSEPDDPDRELT